MKPRWIGALQIKLSLWQDMDGRFTAEVRSSPLNVLPNCVETCATVDDAVGLAILSMSGHARAFLEAKANQSMSGPESKVEPGSRWRHYNGNEYTVLVLTNEYTEHPETYPITVIYQGANGRIWSRRLDDWHRSMTRIEAIRT